MNNETTRPVLPDDVIRAMWRNRFAPLAELTGPLICLANDAYRAGKESSEARKKGIHIGAPACFALEEAIRPVCEAFGAYRGTGGCYVVGSCLERPDWRDVDVRLMLSDDAFAELFPDAVDHCFEQDTRWIVLTVAISERLSKLTGLPIDFQFQPQTHANARHHGPRNAIGIRIARAGGE